jgi:UDP-N-acetylmuramyl pentapeptide phosphotransferase/UDP-N-acetylglucosamine-1-phosphate transferase
MTINAIKILIPAVIAFASGMFLSPVIITTLTSLKMWKKKSVEKALSGGEATITKQLHNDENKQVPRMGGVVIWLSVTFAAFTLWVIPHIFQSFPDKIDFVSRNQTWIILAAMIFTGILGALDDISTSGKHVPLIGDRGLSFYWRLLVVFLLSLLHGLVVSF